MLSNETIRMIARNRLKLTRFVFVVSLSEVVLHGFLSSHYQVPNLLMYIIGSLLILFGNVIRSWAAGIIHKRNILADTGPYGIWRHPLYIGSALIALGFGFILNDPFCWSGIIFLFLIVYPTTIIKEECDLRDLHGKCWDEYVRKVGVIIPRHLTFDRMFDCWSYRQWVKNKEYNSLFTSLIAWNLILILGMLRVKTCI